MARTLQDHLSECIERRTVRRSKSHISTHTSDSASYNLAKKLVVRHRRGGHRRCEQPGADQSSRLLSLNVGATGRSVAKNRCIHQPRHACLGLRSSNLRHHNRRPHHPYTMIHSHNIPPWSMHHIQISTAGHTCFLHFSLVWVLRSCLVMHDSSLISCYQVYCTHSSTICGCRRLAGLLLNPFRYIACVITPSSLFPIISTRVVFCFGTALDPLSSMANIGGMGMGAMGSMDDAMSPMPTGSSGDGAFGEEPPLLEGTAARTTQLPSQSRQSL
jgi:hypothetical protein